MLLSCSTHCLLLLLGIGGIPLLGWALGNRRSWPALLLWLGPVFIALSAADWLLLWLGSWIPEAPFDGGRGDWLRYLVTAGLLLVPAELFSQRLITRMAGGGTFHTEATPGLQDEPCPDNERPRS